MRPPNGLGAFLILLSIFQGIVMTPRKVCVSPGCCDLAVPGAAHCDFHLDRVKAAQAERKAKAKLGAIAVAGAALYSTERWRRERRLFLDRHPLCVDCAELGAVEVATDVDHITPHRGDRKLFFDRSNWQGLCHRCHSRKTAREVFHAKGG